MVAGGTEHKKGVRFGRHRVRYEAFVSKTISTACFFFSAFDLGLVHQLCSTNVGLCYVMMVFRIGEAIVIVEEVIRDAVHPFLAELPLIRSSLT